MSGLMYVARLLVVQWDPWFMMAQASAYAVVGVGTYWVGDCFWRSGRTLRAAVFALLAGTLLVLALNTARLAGRMDVINMAHRLSEADAAADLRKTT
jgi:hypothetical protein